MKTVVKINAIKSKLLSAAKVLGGAVMVSGLISGALLVNNNLSNNVHEDKKLWDNPQPGFGNDISNPKEIEAGAFSTHQSDELADSQSNETDQELYHRYGC